MSAPATPEPWTGSVADVDAWLTAERTAIAAEIRDLEGQLREARVERDRALKELARLRGRGSVRVATTVETQATAVRRVARRGARGVARAARHGAGRRAAGDRRDGADGTPDHPTPAAFREAFRSALDGRRLRIALEGGASDRWTRALRSSGWPIADAPAAADVVILGPGGAAPVEIARGPVLVRAGAATDDERGTVDLTIEEAPADDARLVASLVDALHAWVTAKRIGIAIGPPSWEVAATWGDLHFARALRGPFVRRGHPTRIHVLPEWPDAVSARDDVAIHLFGLLPRRRQAGQRTILWVISHPDRVTDRMLEDADRVYAASDGAADGFRARTRTPVSALHQATDPDVFRVDPSGPRHAVLFVGNTRGVRREIIDWMSPTSLDLAIYGQGWASAIGDPGVVRGDHVPNEELHRWYGAAGVVLADHWPDMRAAGFLSNRLYDVLASGGFAISDDVPGIEAEFDGAVPTARSAGELRWAVRDALADPATRRERAERGQRAVLERHTFANRVETILADLAADEPDPAS